MMAPLQTAALAFSSLILMAAITTFVLLFAVVLIKQNMPTGGLAITTAIFGVGDLLCLAHSIFYLTSCQPSVIVSRSSHMSMRTNVLAASIAHILDLALLAWLQVTQSEVSSTWFPNSIMYFLYVSWSLWGASLVSHIWFILGSKSKRSRKQLSNATSGTPPRSLEVQDETSSVILEPLPLSNGDAFRAGSPEFSHWTHIVPHTAEPRALYPVTSRTRLVPEPVSATDQSKSLLDSTPPLESSPQLATSPPSIRTSSEFDGSSTILKHEPVIPSFSRPLTARPTTPINRQRLEPIPGSQANSPGRPLDFPQQSSNAEEPMRGRQQARKSYELETVVVVHEAADESRVPPRFRKNSITSRPGSPCVDESLIHPLFRSDSPLPPPTPTMATTLTASAFGGRAMSREDFGRASSRSRPVSPAQNRSRAITVSEGRPASPMIHRSRSAGSSRLALSRPPSHGIPPLPTPATGLGISNEPVEVE